MGGRGLNCEVFPEVRSSLSSERFPSDSRQSDRWVSSLVQGSVRHSPELSLGPLVVLFGNLFLVTDCHPLLSFLLHLLPLPLLPHCLLVLPPLTFSASQTPSFTFKGRKSSGNMHCVLNTMLTRRSLGYLVLVAFLKDGDQVFAWYYTRCEPGSVLGSALWPSEVGQGRPHGRARRLPGTLTPGSLLVQNGLARTLSLLGIPMWDCFPGDPS